jgi:hypothetical protein
MGFYYGGLKYNELRFSCAQPGFFPIVTNLEILESFFVRVWNIIFHVKYTRGSVSDTCRRTDNTKLIGRFAGSAKATVSHTSFFVLFPSFYAISANKFKLIPNFLSPITPSGN